MARNTGSVCKQCRREKTKLFLKGERCITDRCSFERRAYPPGEHGRRRIKESDYLLQIREKQKARRVYGIMERQFRKYYQQALKEKGRTGENLLRILESRLDNVLYRSGFSVSRNQARQLISHGHFTVNGRKVDIPSYQVKPQDTVAVKESSKNLDVIKNSVQGYQREPVPWLDVDKKNITATMVDRPAGEGLDVSIRDEMIVELYSR